MASDELLSAFKVASFNLDEEEEVSKLDSIADESTKDWVRCCIFLVFFVIIIIIAVISNNWLLVIIGDFYVRVPHCCRIRCILLYLFIYFLLQDEIIPEDFRAKVEEEEKQKEMADLYLPPRKRKTVNQAGQKVGICVVMIIVIGSSYIFSDFLILNFFI